MATIDLSLNALKIPALDNFTPDFGTMITETQANKGGLSTFEVNRNMMMPWSYMRPKVVEENSTTTVVEYDAKLVFSARSGTTPSAGYSVVMGQGAYVGCTVTFTNLMSYSCKVYQYDGTTTLFDIPSGFTLSAVWNGSVWVWTTSGAITANDPRPVSSAAVHAAIGTSNGTITRNTSNTTGIGEIFVRKFGKVAMFHCYIEGCQLRAGELITFATVSEGFRPSSSLSWTLVDSDFVVEGLRTFLTNSGEIQALSPQTTTQILRLQSVYFTD